MSKLVEKTVCFVGHRPQKISYLFDEESKEFKSLRSTLKETIIDFIENENVKHFVSGMVIGADMMCAEIIIELKKTYPDITLECAVSCETQAEYWTMKYRDKYFNTVAASDKETMLQWRYTHDCVMKRNRYMVDKSDIIIAVWDGGKGLIKSTVNYAVEKNKVIKHIPV